VIRDVAYIYLLRDEEDCSTQFRGRKVLLRDWPIASERTDIQGPSPYPDHDVMEMSMAHNTWRTVAR
jgi:hypothetical protein